MHIVSHLLSRDSLKSKNKSRDPREPNDMIKFSKVLSICFPAVLDALYCPGKYSI